MAKKKDQISAGEAVNGKKKTKATSDKRETGREK